MRNYGQVYLDDLGRCPAGTFESSFATVANKMGLGSILERNELTLLYEAAFRATYCNLALNGLGKFAGEVKAEDERLRSQLEREFMIARDTLLASPGWESLSVLERNALRRIFLDVFVTEERLA